MLAVKAILEFNETERCIFLLRSQNFLFMKKPAEISLRGLLIQLSAAISDRRT